MSTLNDNDKAKLALLEDWERRAIWFDGGPELLSHQQMHRFHKTEPYIGCAFCRNEFVPRQELDRLVTAVRWIQLEAVTARDDMTDAMTAASLQRIYDRCAAELTAIRDQEHGE